MLVWFAIVGACADDDEPSESQAVSGSCEAYCAKLELCDSANVDESDCVEDCEDDKGYSAAALNVLAECIEEASCNEIESGEWIDCVDDGFSGLKLSSTGGKFCDDAASKLEDCDDSVDEGSVSEACEQQARARRDDFISANVKCLDKSCDDVAQCLADIADDYDTDEILSFNCCTADNFCNWENDGYCDCGGTFEWDAADCGL